MKSIYIEEDFLNVGECTACIQFYMALKDQTFFYQENNTEPLDLMRRQEFFQSITDRLKNLICGIDSGFVPEISNHEIVKWSPKSKMDLHNDYDRDKWSAILYLNDDFFGGRTIFENGIEVKAKMGTLVLFNGSEVKHGVTEVLNGERYTMAYWISGQNV